MYGYDQKAVRRLLEYANCALKLEHKIVAMKFLFTEEEFEAADVPKLSGKMSYCTMVIHAGEGESMKADIYTEVCGKDGFVCRYGGDEFLIFLYTDDRDIFKEKAERIYQIIDEADGFSAEISEKLGQSFSIDKQHQISCSIGIAAGDHICTENDMTEMIKRADDLLYSIKTTTKGTYRI